MLFVDIQRLHRDRRWPRNPFDHRDSPTEAEAAQSSRDALAHHHRVQTAQQCRQAQAVHRLERRWLL